MDSTSVTEVGLDQAPWQQLQPLLDVCYPRPPRDVFERLVVASHRSQRPWEGIGQQLVQTLLQAVRQEGPFMVSPTTRIPAFFSPFGFQPCCHLADGSTAMLILLPGPAVSEPHTQ